MTQEQKTVLDGEVDLRESLSVILRKWWVVASFTIVSVVLAVVYTGHMPDVYEARTKLLIVGPVSERLLEENPVQANPVAGPNLSVDTLSALATANDLLEKIIVALDLQDSATQRPWAVEQLEGMMQSEVETASQGGTPLPLLTMSVHGREPDLVSRIANKWAEAFIQGNSDLFASEAVRSYEFILAQYKETEDRLNVLEDERQKYVVDNPLALLKDEVGIKQADLRQYLDTLLNLSAQLELTEKEYEGTLVHLDELSVDGRWIGFQSNPGTSGEMLSSTSEQQRVLQVKKQLFQIENEIETFLQENEVALLKQRLAFKQGLLEDYMSQLEAAENNLKVEYRRLETLMTEIEKQPQFLVLVKAIEDPALWEQLSLDPDTDTWERLRELGLRTEEVNPAFVTLTDRIIDTETNIATEEERITVLTGKVQDTRDDVKELEKDVADNDIQLSRLHSELALIQQNYDKEQATYADLQDTVMDLGNEVRTLQVQRDAYQKLVDAYRADVGALSTRIAYAELQVRRFDRQSQALEDTFSQLGTRVQEARIARAEETGYMRIVESAIVPQVPFRPDRQQPVMLAAIMGLLLGVMVVFLVHYIQKGDARLERDHAGNRTRSL